MHKNPASQSGLFNPRVLLAFVLCSAGVLVAMLSFAAKPSSGMTESVATSPRDSFFVDKHAGPLSGNATAPAASMPLAAAPAGSWFIVTSPNTSTSTTDYNILQGVTCASASECWAVGYYYNGSAYQTLIEQWDGTSWVVVSSPNSSATDNDVLYKVTCVSASDCWAVGYSAGTSFQTLIERWNGISWTIVNSPNSIDTQFTLQQDQV